ncbi:mechanosensitive ion channel family protein, partial [Acidocella sp. MX-AZ02]|uniref:mechanosensitive ion channel family protein n=2 Tax=unclassified Acidocella TaxID=2648610 RepID=UPI00028E9F04
DDFTDALHRSTRLTPVWHWLAGFANAPQRRADALAIGMALAIAVVPGMALDVLLVLALRGAAALCARQAVPRRNEYLPTPDLDGLASAEEGESEQRPPRRTSLRAWSRRFGFALLKFLLMLLPIAAFGITEQLILNSGLIARRPAHLAVVGIVNAYLAARLTQEVLRLLFSPNAPSLRLAHLASTHAKWLMRRAMLLIITIFVAFCIISVAEILFLPKDGAGALLRLAALVVHLEVAFAIWRSRRVISRWIAGKPGSDSYFAGMRRRFSKVWYIFALFYVLALWVAWAGGVQNALVVLLRALLVVFIALVLGRLAWVGSNRALARIFPDEDSAARRSAVLGRARTYNPLIRLVVRFVIAMLVLVLVLQGWGVDAFGWLLTNNISRALLSAGFSVLVTVAIAIVLWEAINYQLDARIERLNNAGKTRQASRLRTLLPMLRAAIGIVLVLVALIICLSRIGVNTTGLLAVSSVVGIAVGFGSQKLVQDIITGLFLLFEDAMQVGDVVTLGGMSGTVERLSLRTIRLRGGDGSVNIIPFSSVTTVTNQTRDFSYAQISVMVSYDEDIERVSALLKEIGAKMRAEAAWGAMMRDDLQLFGLDSFGELGLVFTGQIRTGPGQHWAVRREFNARVQKRFAEEGIALSYRRQSMRLDLPPGEMLLGPPPKPAAP